MRLVAIATVMGMGTWLATPSQGQVMPGAFENMTHIVCADPTMAFDLLTVFEKDNQLGEKLLARLAEEGMCERATFSGKPVTDIRRYRTGKQREGHVFEVEVTKGDVLKGRIRAYMLLYILSAHEAQKQKPPLLAVDYTPGTAREQTIENWRSRDFQKLMLRYGPY